MTTEQSNSELLREIIDSPEGELLSDADRIKLNYKIRCEKRLEELGQPEFRRFWFGKGKISSYYLRKFLEENGFGRYQSNESRLIETQLFKNERGVLQLHNPNSVKRWLREYFESLDDFDYELIFYYPDDTDIYREDLLSSLQDYTETMLKTKCLDDLSVWSEDSFSGTNPFNMFNDTKDKAYILFENGVVEITKDSIDLLPIASIEDKGQVWESSIRKHNISLTDKDEGMFCKFFNRTMYRERDDKTNVSDWMDEFELNDESNGELTALRTSYGYLIHSHNTPDVSKLVFYIDEHSELGRPEGGNGKSVVMESIEHYKKKALQDGKRFRQNMDGDRFQFSNVELDTKFVFIDDITPEFHFEKLFSMITGDMEVEGKGVNKFVIPKSRKPKMGLTTNYVLASNGTSFERRQHIVEFGNYWNRCLNEGESPSDDKHLGGTLFSWDKGDDEWNKFYNFGFKCVQEYLQSGLVSSTNKNYLTKSIKLLVEGKDGDGQGTEWLIDWVKTTRISDGYLKDGISEDELYSQFTKDNVTLVPSSKGIWDLKYFSQAIWTLVDLTDGWYYNKHLARNGNTKSQRRWLKGTRGNQVPYIRITTSFDDDWSK